MNYYIDFDTSLSDSSSNTSYSIATYGRFAQYVRSISYTLGGRAVYRRKIYL